MSKKLLKNVEIIKLIKIEIYYDKFQEVKIMKTICKKYFMIMNKH